MYRRLYFLFPTPKETHQVVNELEAMGIDESDIHAYSPHTQNLRFLPKSSAMQEHDTASLLEKVFWNGILLIFLIALIGFFVSLYFNAGGWTLFTVVIMASMYSMGYYFTTHIPNTHLKEFKSAMAHDEILLSIDVPKNKIIDINRFIHYRHPEAVDGGTSWSLHALGL